ncbi:AAA family ATPase [Pseudoroseomonas cervicalis]|uniref:Putative plasmid partitioning protein RepA n=1 Tax=Pseudoroseomonas cervicalis ATCC 49957 TaxID=525371 RepID=D5RGT4_9PROT|nr:AAA family ATPase [Pseudoroseomonas cervicalis]EFH13495.1 putative plasmid partitioning protein RepA [Pseudoroseomonas cervicalis ATCC 49957]
MDQAESFRQIAEVLRAAQRTAIEVENAPEKRKRLRSFSVQEAAALLGVTPRQLRQAAGLAPEGRGIAPRARLDFAELQAARERLGRMPRRDAAKGEALASVVFTNFKGGSAKTTSSVHFAQHLALQGYRVLLVDLDSQASSTAQFGLDPAREVGAANCFTAWVARGPDAAPELAQRLCQPSYWPNIDLLPAGAALAEAEEALARRAANGEPEEILYFDELAAFLAAVAPRYDVAVVDTRPDVNMLMTAALHAATGLVIPTRATMTDLASTAEFFAHLAGYTAEYRAAFGHGLDFAFARILVTAYDPTDRSQEALLGLLRERFGDRVLPEPFLHSRIMGTAGFGKETLYEYEPSTDRAAYNRVIASANAVNRAIEAELSRHWGRGA